MNLLEMLAAKPPLVPAKKIGRKPDTPEYRYKIPKERLALPGNWRHTITVDEGLNHEVFVDINKKVEMAIVKTTDPSVDSPKLIGLLNRSQPIHLEIDHARNRVQMAFRTPDEIMVYIILKEVNQRMRIFIKNAFAEITRYEVRHNEEEDDEPLSLEEQAQFVQRHESTKRNDQIPQGTESI